MLRKNIGKNQKNSVEKKNNSGLVLPKSLWKFYFKYAVSGSTFSLVAWAISFFIVAMDGVLFPNFQRWFVALFENPVPAGQTFMQYAMPTIILITGLLLVIDTFMFLRNWAYAHWSPKIQNRISVVLNDYVHGQSMSFWTGRMAGKIHAQIMYVSRGFESVIEFWRIFGLFVVIAINMGLILSINKYVALIFVVVFILRAGYSWAMIKPMTRVTKDASAASSELSGRNVDSLSNFSVVKLFAGARKEKEYLKPLRDKNIEKHLRK